MPFFFPRLWPLVSQMSKPRKWTRGQKLNPNIFFSNFSGASEISWQNPGISRQKSLIPWVSRDIPNFLAPTPSRGRPPPHQKISGLKSFGLGSFFVPDGLGGLGRKLLLSPPPPSGPQRTPEKQTVATVTASHKILTLEALSSSLNAGTAKRGCLG